MSEIKVGTCGWGFYRGGFKAFIQKYSLVEVQQTFYKLPMVKTAERWREQAPKGFEFCVKAFQAITHLPTSPTWRRSGIKIAEAMKEKYGWLRPSRENIEAWRRTGEICDALEAKICVIQSPPNFKCTPENAENMRKFISKIDRGELTLVWEPRGNWKEHPDEIAELCEDLELVHAVDLMRREPLSKHRVAYIRLHGLNPREYDYNYEYSLAELRRLASKAKGIAKKHRQVYLMFNNYQMYMNASQLMEILRP